MSIKLSTSDNQEFSIEKEIAIQSILLKNLIEDFGESDNTIPLPNITGPIMQKVIEWCEYHKNDCVENEEKINEWDNNFVNVDQETLFELILATNYLDIKPMLDMTCKNVANIIKGKSPEEIRKTFNINDFTPEEQVCCENECSSK